MPLQYILKRAGTVHEYLQVVTNDMSIFAGGALNEDGAFVVALLGDAMCGAMFAGLAGEGQLVSGLIGSGSLFRSRGVRIRGCRCCKLRIVARKELGEMYRPPKLGSRPWLESLRQRHGGEMGAGRACSWQYSAGAA
jgi:hypothetical protein